MATFGPFAKSKFFDFFNFLFFRLKRCFFSLECHKTHFTRLAWLKKKMQKWSILDQNDGLTHLKKKYQFFDFFNFLFL